MADTESFDTYVDQINNNTLLLLSDVSVKDNTANGERNNIFVGNSFNILVKDGATNVKAGINLASGTGIFSVLDTNNKHRKCYFSDNEEYGVKVSTDTSTDTDGYFMYELATGTFIDDEDENKSGTESGSSSTPVIAPIDKDIPTIYTGDEAEEIKVMTLVDTYINGENQFSAIAPIFIENGRTFLGIRDTAYALNIDPAAIKWDDKTKTATITKSGAVLEITEGSYIVKMTYRGYVYEIKSDATAQIRNDRIYLPFRIIFQQFGYKVNWDNETRIITCTKNK